MTSHTQLRIHPLHHLLELNAAVAARAVAKRRCATTCGACISREIHGLRTIALEHVAPVTAYDRGDALEIILLDQEVCARTSTFAGARRAADDHRDAGGE